jgi:hypothetical protein
MNWSSDPGFVDPANGDFHLRADSQAIDKALCGSIVFSVSGPSTYLRVALYFDMDNDRRPEIPPPGLNHMGCDCGADEFFTGLGPNLAPNLAPIYYLLFQ